MPPTMALGDIYRERFKRGSQNFSCLSGTIDPTNKHSGYNILAASGRKQNAIKYCKHVREMGPAGQRVE